MSYSSTATYGTAALLALIRWRWRRWWRRGLGGAAVVGGAINLPVTVKVLRALGGVQRRMRNARPDGARRLLHRVRCAVEPHKESVAPTAALPPRRHTSAASRE